MNGQLGISSIRIGSDTLRDYFYVADRQGKWERQRTLYQALQASVSASPAELRLAFKLRDLELRAFHAPKGECRALERAFNILAHEELRACYDALLKDSLAPAVFPSGSFGSILVVGERSRTGDAFFTKRILAFLLGKRGTGQPLSFAVVQRLGLISDAAENRSARIEQNVLWAEERAGFAFRLA